MRSSSSSSRCRQLPSFPVAVSCSVNHGRKQKGAREGAEDGKEGHIPTITNPLERQASPPRRRLLPRPRPLDGTFPSTLGTNIQSQHLAFHSTLPLTTMVKVKAAPLYIRFIDAKPSLGAFLSQKQRLGDRDLRLSPSSFFVSLREGWETEITLALSETESLFLSWGRRE